MDSILKRLFGEDCPTAHELESLIKIALVNSHPSIDFAESLPPNIIEVGGLQIKEPKLLPDHLEFFINRRKKGAVLMSLGTNIRSDMMTKETLENIIETFKQLPQYNFIWKFESDNLPVKLPANVLITKWLPQNDILAHPNVTGFISHVGLLSLHETLWWGKPIVAIPFIADQHRNTYKAISSGFGVKIDFQKLNVEIFKKSILEVFENPKYRNKVQLISQKFRDQKETPLERAIWWCEYMLRNSNVDHLRLPNVTLGILGPLLIDMQIIILTIFAIACAFTSLVFIKLKNLFTSVNKEKKNN
jgi:UDP:flavonoid glycosyltransferase YjiC (YdhE family)